MNPTDNSSLTACALNELSQEERIAFEKAMKSESSLLTEAQATQSFCQFMQIHLHDESAALTDSQRERLRTYASWKPKQAVSNLPARTEQKKLQPPAWYRRPSLVLPLSAAAAVALTMWFGDQGGSTSSSIVAENGPVIITAPVAMQQPAVRRTVLSPALASADNVEPRQLGLSHPEAHANREGAAVPVNLNSSPKIAESTPVSISGFQSPGGDQQPTITLMKTGAGEIKLSGVNTYNGTTTITIVDGKTSQSVTTIISTTGATLNSGTIVGTPSGRYVGRSIQELGEARHNASISEIEVPN